MTSKITIVLVKDEAAGGYTAYIEETPAVVAEGETIGEAISNIGEIYGMFAEDLKEIQNEEHV